MKNRNDESQLNNADVIAKIFESMKDGNVVLVNFTYVAIQHNHGQINFSAFPSKTDAKTSTAEALDSIKDCSPKNILSD